MPTIETMDRGKALDKEQFGLNVEPKYSRQYSSPHTDEIPVDVLEDIALSEADRRLAEMGYIQVCPFTTSSATSSLKGSSGV